jgi:SOS-response transcriptional repressor LexA
MRQLSALTNVEISTLHFIIDYIDRCGYSPSLADIASAESICINTAHYRVGRLMLKGWLSKPPGVNRALRVVAGLDDPIVAKT